MKKIISLLVFSLLVTGCTVDQVVEQENNNIEVNKEITSIVPDYFLETSDFDVEMGEDWLTIDTSKEIKDVELYLYTDKSEKEFIELELEEKGKYKLAKSIAKDSLPGLEIDGSDKGLFFTTKMLASSSISLGIPDDPITIRPTSGYWEFTLEGSSGDLSGGECPTGAAAFSSIGEVKMDVDQNGLSSSMSLEDFDVNFYRPNPDSTHYDSYEYSFTTPTSVGTVSFEFDAIGQEKVTGKLYWDNNEGCSAVYNFTMELVTPTEFPPYVLKQGTWNLQYQNSIICGDVQIIPEQYFIPNSLGQMDIVATGPNDMMPNFSFNNSSLNLMQQGYSNHYVPVMPIQFLGIYIDPSTGQSHPLSGIYDVWATSEESAMGMLNLFGPDGCVAPVPFSLDFIN